MENIKIYDYLHSEIAINIDDAESISKTIITKYSMSHTKVKIDFSNIKSLISPFMRSLLKPLVISRIDFEAVSFDNTRNKEIYGRILTELKTVGTTNIRELDN